MAAFYIYRSDFSLTRQRFHFLWPPRRRRPWRSLGFSLVKIMPTRDQEAGSEVFVGCAGRFQASRCSSWIDWPVYRHPACRWLGFSLVKMNRSASTVVTLRFLLAKNEPTQEREARIGFLAACAGRLKTARLCLARSFICFRNGGGRA